MALQYGMNITASDMKSLLEKNDKQQSGIRSWRQLFGNASLGFNAQSDALTTDYTEAMRQAYESNFRQRDAVLGAGLNTGVTREMLAQSRNDLHTAYETYVRNYGNDMATIAKGYGEEVGEIDAGLTERATNFSNLYNSAYKYLSEELYGASMTRDGTAENGAEAIYEGEGKDSEFKGYKDISLDYMSEHGLGRLTDGEGNLLSWDAISHQLFNSDGSLTRKGIQFFDQIFNSPQEEYRHADGKRTIRSFDQWLSDQEDTFDNYDANFSGMAKNGRELRDWWASQDGFNYTFAGTNKGTAQALLGRESTDDKYGVYEYADASGMEEFNGTALDLMKSTADTTARAQKNLDMAIQYNITAPRGYYMDTTQYKKELTDAWTSYRSGIESAYSKLSSFFTEKMGSEMSDTFWAQNSELRAQYDALMKRAYSTSRYDETIASDINKWYTNLIKQMTAYIQKYGYKGKVSGF